MEPLSPEPWLLTDRDWRSIADTIQLPDTARRRIERAIKEFRFMRDAQQHRHPAKLRANLKRAADAALKFVAAVSALGEPERLELEFSGLRTRERDKRIVALILDCTRKDVQEIMEWCDYCANEITASKKGSDSTPLRLFVKSLDGILFDFKDKHIRRSKELRYFVETACNVADPNVGRYSIDEAMKRLVTKRGKTTR